MKKTYQTTLSCLFVLLPISFSTLQARHNYRRNNDDRENRFEDYNITRDDFLEFHIIEKVPKRYRYRMKTVPPREKEYLILSYVEKKKDLTTSYLLFPFGLHGLYLNSIISSILGIVIVLSLIGAIYFGIYFPLQSNHRLESIIENLKKSSECKAFLTTYFISLCIECDRIPRVIQENNEKIFEDLLIERGY